MCSILSGLYVPHLHVSRQKTYPAFRSLLLGPEVSDKRIRRQNRTTACSRRRTGLNEGRKEEGRKGCQSASL